MLELLAPAGSMEALRAAVQNGADAVYLGAGAFNARMGARNFTPEELPEAVSYCHIRGAKVHLTLNTLASDLEMPDVAKTIRTAAAAGVDAFIVQDLGVVSLCREIAPEVPVHASTQMSIHSLDGVRQAAALGVSRVVLSRELSAREIETICRQSPVEIEVFVHGALCMCYSGQCYLSAVIGQRSGNRGQCAQPCRLPYGYGRYETRYPLSLKDNCLIGYLQELNRMGVASIKIEGRAKRPEYVATVVRIYRSMLDNGQISEQDYRDLEAIFSRQGFTDGYYKGAKGSAMFGTRKDTREDKLLLSAARASYETGEHPRVPVRFAMVAQKGQPVRLGVQDYDGNACVAEGSRPEIALYKPITTEEVAERLRKTGGTPYYMEDCQCRIDPDVTVSAAAINALRRDALSQLTALRGRPPKLNLQRPADTFRHPAPAKQAVITISILKAEQLTNAVLRANPAILYVPLSELAAHPEIASVVPASIELCAVMPRVVWDSDLPAVQAQLSRLNIMGVRTVLTGNLGQIALLQAMKFSVRGDYGLNIFNSRSVNALRSLGLISATCSFEMKLPQIRDLSKGVPMEMLVYGRLPLMLTENCIIRNRTGTCSCENAGTKLVDRVGEEFPIVRDPGTCRSMLLNGKKLYMLDKLEELRRKGVSAFRLSFTTENPTEISKVLRCLEDGTEMDSAGCTRGLYMRGV